METIKITLIADQENRQETVLQIWSPLLALYIVILDRVIIWII